VNKGKALTLRQQRRLAEERRWAAEQRQEHRERARREWLKKQLAHGKGSYSYAVGAQAKQPSSRKMQAKQALSLRQDRNGELAQENMGRPHGCYVEQVTGGTVILDDCDPVQILKSQISILALHSKHTRALALRICTHKRPPWMLSPSASGAPPRPPADRPTHESRMRHARSRKTIFPSQVLATFACSCDACQSRYMPKRRPVRVTDEKCLVKHALSHSPGTRRAWTPAMQ